MLISYSIYEGVLWDPPRNITTLRGSLILLEGSDPSWPSLISHTAVG